jgi:UDP-galactopyranose mutase
MSVAQPVDLICLSHLRWDFVFQRPNHLMSRCARERRVFFVEEPLLHQGPAELEVMRTEHAVTRVVPKLPLGAPAEKRDAALARMIDTLLVTSQISRYELWYYTPMALPATRHLSPRLIVYDVMDELKNFKNAPRELLHLERELFSLADVVFTGGGSLYRAKRHLHAHVHELPSSVDVAHFSRARHRNTDPGDQACLDRPRLGFFGVIDERMDLELVARLCELEPRWQLVMVGPVVKIDPAQLPRLPNLHWLGPRSYAQLPDYISGWDVAIMPFALNDSTRFISPTKTPEFLAAGRPVISTPVADVISPYSDLGLVEIAADAEGFAATGRRLMAEDARPRQHRADAFLAATSWEKTWHQMSAAMQAARERRLASVRAPPATAA